MKRLAALFLLAPFSVAAEPVSIRTGEHDTFSRFVFAIGEGTGWEIEPVEGGILLNLDGRSDGFDTSTVYDRIPRDRVADVTQPATNQLFFAFDCACSADTFLWRPGQLVVDIVDGGEFLEPLPPQAADLETDTVGPILSATTAPQALPDLLALRQGGFLALPAPSPTPAPSQPVASVVEPLGEADEDDISATEAALIEGLSRAASQGFLDANVTEIEEPEPPVEAVAEETPPPPEPEPREPFQPGIGITTALDRNLAMVGDAIERRVTQSCLPTDMFQFAEWGDDSDFHAQVAGLAEALAGEFGEEPREAQDRLARLYLHFGFGVEVKTMLAADLAQSQDRRVMLQLAGLIDEYEGDYALIAAQAGCETPSAVWAFLAAPHRVTDEERNQVLQSLFALPQPLRSHIAPRVSRGFLDIGDTETAERALEAATEVTVAKGHDAAATRAMIAEALDEPAVAISVLAEEVANNARTTPDSLIRLIELGIQNGVPVAEADLILAAAMQQEHRNTPAALQLAIAEAAGRTQLGQYQMALDLLTGLEDEGALRELNTTFKALTQNADPTTFLGFAFAEEPAGLSPETQNTVAARLIDLGFPERALAFLSGSAQREAAAERRYLRAAALIGTGHYSDAVDEVVGITTPRANDLRAQAYAGLGEHRAALAASNTDTPDATLEFRAGAWDRLSVDDDAVLSTFAQSVLEPPAEGPATSLADRREILAQSRDSRRAVENLLLRFDGTSIED